MRWNGGGVPELAHVRHIKKGGFLDENQSKLKDGQREDNIERIIYGEILLILLHLTTVKVRVNHGVGILHGKPVA